MSCIELCIPSNVFSPYTPADKVAITGDFDNWEHSEFVLVYDGRAGNYKVTIPGVSTENIAFKFVINDSDWITLSYFNTVTDSFGHVNNILNPKDYITAGTSDNQLDDHLDEITINTVTSTDAIADDEEEDDEDDENDEGEETEENDMEAVRNHRDSDTGKASGGSPPITTEHDSTTDGEYIHVSSRGELSSSEDLELEPSNTSGEDHGEQLALQYEAVQKSSTPSRHLQNLVSAVKRVKTYWRG